MVEVKYILLPDDFVVDEALILQLESALPSEILLKIGEKITSKRLLSLLGWRLLKHRAKGQTLNQISFHEHGKPFFNGAEFQFNLSNTKNTVVLASGNLELGIDVEWIRKPRSIIYKRVFSDREVSLIEESKDASRTFTRLWTRKEAVVKLFGGGIQMGLRNFEVIEDEINAFGRKVFVQEIQIADRISHVATFQKVDVCVEEFKSITSFLA